MNELFLLIILLTTPLPPKAKGGKEEILGYRVFLFIPPPRVLVPILKVLFLLKCFTNLGEVHIL